MASSRTTPASPSLVLVVVLVASPTFSRALSPAPRSGAAMIAGRLDVSLTGPALKHWGISAVTAAFVPDADRSSYAGRIREAENAGALCAALGDAGARDAAIAVARVDGDGDLEHRSGDEMQLAFRIDVPRLPAAARGVVYVCSSPIVAVMARGGYPNERFEPVADRRFRWMSAPLTVHSGETTRIVGMASVDASQW